MTEYYIKMKDLAVGYQGNALISDINLKIKKGEIVTLIGPNGAGKTTAAQLIGRYWDADSGTVKIGGVPVNELKAENLSDLTAFVFQDVFLMEDTLLENIRMGTKATEEQVRQAAKAAQIDDFIMSLPDGYDTVIGEGGATLSGGEKQRISIARAILKDAPIIILDEATSSVDPENENLLMGAISELTKNKTVIMIAHRLKTVRNADQIFVLSGGHIVQTGKHEDLIRQPGIYADFIGIRKKAIGWKLK